MRAECELHGAGLDAIVQFRGRAVIVDVLHILRRHAGIAHGQLHRARGLLARIVHAHPMIGVAGRGVTGQLGIDERATSQCRLLPFHHEHPRAFA